MAIIKCKMCGGDLRIEEGSTVCECEYCGTRQTVPSADNDMKMVMLLRIRQKKLKVIIHPESVHVKTKYLQIV